MTGKKGDEGMKNKIDNFRNREHRERRNSGFTLAELLIVVAIIAVLVAISIPIFSSQLHKARVATDWANLRAYYAEIQADFIATGQYHDKVPDAYTDHNWMHTEINFLNGQNKDSVIEFVSAEEIDSSRTLSRIEIVFVYEIFAGAPGKIFGIWWKSYANYRCTVNLSF